MSPGDKLRSLRERLGLTLRDVEAASSRIAENHQNPDYTIPISRLSDIETKSIVPSIYRLYSLAAIYRASLPELLALFDVDLGRIHVDSTVVNPTQTHLAKNFHAFSVRMPVKLDPAFSLSKTSNFGRLIMEWGTAPLVFLEQFENANFTYGYIGLDDFTMYPLLLPGSFVQVDESKNKVVDAQWQNEYERPIYFVQTRQGFTCCWCDQEGANTVLLPHPLSPVRARTVRSDRDVEILGQIIAVAMRLDSSSLSPGSTTRLLSRSI